MRNVLVLLAVFFVGSLYGQVNLNKVMERSKKKAEQQIEKRIERRIDKGVDKTLDSVEDGIDNSVKGENPDDKNTSQSKKAAATTPESSSKTANNPPASGPIVTSPAEQPTVLTWSNFDFVPGSEIIFEDNHVGEQNGEFPGKWDLVSGVMENASVNGENIIYFRETGNFPNGMVPLIKDATADYLPDEFTVEFDCYFEQGKYSSFRVFFFDAKNQKRLPYCFLDVLANQLKFGNGVAEKQYPNTQFANVDKTKSLWRHVSISFNKRALKVYMDDTRLINIPNLTDNPTGITIGANHASTEKHQFVKNVRIAKGAVPLYDKVLTDGKFVTTGIKFDVNKATIKPESMGTINFVVKMMQDYPDLNFSVEGHTDSDGADETNQRLSEARAKAVLEVLIQQGVAPGRLTSKGWGESKPLNGNGTSEEKAQNRRVEFVKTN